MTAVGICVPAAFLGKQKGGREKIPAAFCCDYDSLELSALELSVSDEDEDELELELELFLEELELDEELELELELEER